MNAWMIVSIVLAAVCAALIVYCVQQQSRLKGQEEQQESLEAARQEVLNVRSDDVRRRREIAALHRALENEQEHSEHLERELDELYFRLEDAQKRQEQAEARRIRAEKEVYAGRMRSDLLEKQIEQLRQEQLNQEKLYQDILSERESQIAQLQEGQAKRRVRKKSEVLDQQVTLNDILGGI